MKKTSGLKLLCLINWMWSDVSVFKWVLMVCSSIWSTEKVCMAAVHFHSSEKVCTYLRKFRCKVNFYTWRPVCKIWCHTFVLRMPALCMRPLVSTACIHCCRYGSLFFPLVSNVTLTFANLICWDKLLVHPSGSVEAKVCVLSAILCFMLTWSLRPSTKTDLQVYKAW